MLTEIRDVRRGSKRRLLLVDDEPWRAAPADVVREAGLQVGDDETAAELAVRLASVEPRSARDRAVRLLTYKDRSSAELLSRLDDDGYLSQVAADTVARLSDLGLVDDDRFARVLARTLTQGKGVGRSRASHAMIARGVPPEAVALILDELLSPEEEDLSASTQAVKFARRTGATRERVAARLMRKGFSPRIAFAAAREAFENVNSPDSGECWDDTVPLEDDAAL